MCELLTDDTVWVTVESVVLLVGGVLVPGGVVPGGVGVSPGGLLVV